jgi:hypothetical protein
MAGAPAGAPDALQAQKESVSYPWPLVRVRWVDSSSPRAGWLRLAEWAGLGSLECVSVGYVIDEDETQKTIAPHIAYPDDEERCQGNGIIVIPVRAIVSVETLISSSRNDGARPKACAAGGRSFDRPSDDQPSPEFPSSSPSRDASK